MYSVVRAKIGASRLAARVRAKRARPTVSPRRNNGVMKLGPSPRRNNGVMKSKEWTYYTNRQGGMWN